MSSEYRRPSTDSEADVEYIENGGYFRVPVPVEGTASIAAISAVAEINGVNPLQMDSAYDGYNFDVLDQMASYLAVDEVEFDGVTVTVADHRVTITSDGFLRIRPPE